MKKLLLTICSLVLVLNKYNLKAYSNYKLINGTEYEITENFTITNEGDKLKDFSINLNTLLKSESPYHEIENVSVSGLSDNGIKKGVTFDNSKINISDLKQNEKVSFSRNTDVIESGINYTASLSSTKGDYSNFKEYEKYTKPEEKIESDNENIINKAKEIADKEKNPYYKAKKIFEYVNMNIEYNENNSNKGALNTLLTKNGVCEDYADLFTALCRAQGIPSRVVYGYRIKPEEIGYTFKDISKDAHAWSEFYLPEYGWIIVEPTFLYYVNDKKTVPENQFANADEANHILISYLPTDNIKYNYKLQRGDLEKVDIDVNILIRKKLDLNTIGNSKRSQLTTNLKDIVLKNKTYSSLTWNLKYKNKFDFIKAGLYKDNILIKDITIGQNESNEYDIEFDNLNPSAMYTLKIAASYKDKQNIIYEGGEKTSDYNIDDFKINIKNSTNTSLIYDISHNGVSGDIVEIYDEKGKLIDKKPFANKIEDTIRKPSVFSKNVTRKIKIKNTKYNIESKMITLNDKLPSENIFNVLYFRIDALIKTLFKNNTESIVPNNL